MHSNIHLNYNPVNNETGYDAKHDETIVLNIEQEIELKRREYKSNTNNKKKINHPQLESNYRTQTVENSLDQ